MLTRVQNDLFDVGADLCTPIEADPKYPPLRVTQEQVDTLEREIDRYNGDLEPLRSFVLAGGTTARRTCTSPAPSSAGRSGPPGVPWRPTRTR